MDSNAAVRELSRLIFGGAQYRIEVAANLHAGQPFTALDLVLLLGDPPGKGSVHTELGRLRQAGLILEGRKARSDRSKPLVPIDCALWDAARSLQELATHRWNEASALSKLLPDGGQQQREALRLLSHPQGV